MTSSVAVVGTFGASVVTVHVVNGVQQFVVFQIPPPSCATYATLGFFGSKAIAFMRPDTRPNVKHGAWQPVLACGCGPSGLAAGERLDGLRARADAGRTDELPAPRPVEALRDARP